MSKPAAAWIVSLVLCAACSFVAPPLLADQGRDSEQARIAVERGEAQALAQVLSRVGPQIGGEIVGVSFERERGRWIYEFKVIDTAGRLSKVRVDAATAAILERENH